MTTPLFIGPYDVGVQQNLKPFMLPENAFPNLLNTFVFRGRVQRKDGYQKLGRLRLVVTTASGSTLSAGGAGVVTYNIFTGLSLLATYPNAQIESGSLTNITITIGAPISQTLTATTGSSSLTITGAGPISAASLNYATGVLSLTFTGAAAASSMTISLAFYPGLPVMGIRLRELSAAAPGTGSTNFQKNIYTNIYFDTVNSYRFTNNQFSLLPSTTPTTWTGTNSDFFWSTNYQANNNGNLFWVTNGTSADSLRYYDGSDWTIFTPATNGTDFLFGCLMVIPYKDRLLTFSTAEGINRGALTYNRQRVRWSQNGDATDGTNGWRDDIVGRGGFVDAPTGEAIISCGFIKDQLIVYFERSTWQINYTGNEVLPFTWFRINAELGAESTFSAVTFDNGLLAFGNVGVHACNGQSAARIDDQIPDEIFSIHEKSGSSADGPLRTFGIRNFQNECVYFAYAKFQAGTSAAGKIFYPNRMMIYNYRNDTFAFFDDHATCFGYYQIDKGMQWQNVIWTWAEWAQPWNSGFAQSGTQVVAFGNQQGYVEIIDSDYDGEDLSLSISSITAGSIPNSININSPQHNFEEGQYVRIQNALGFTSLNDTSFEVIQVIDADNFLIKSSLTPSGYTGLGEMIQLSNMDIQTKMFTPFWSRGKRYNLKYIDILVDSTSSGQINVDIYVDMSNSNSMTDQSTPTNPTSITANVLQGNSVLSTSPEGANLPYYQFQVNQAQIWKRFYTWATGETFQVELSLNDTEMRDPSIQEADLAVHGMVFYFEEAGEFY